MSSGPLYALIRKPAFAALLLLPAIGLAGCGKKQEAEAKPARPVLVATVQYQPEAPARSFVGTIRPRIETGRASCRERVSIAV